jgi:(2Fe-2S) ferredoxin
MMGQTPIPEDPEILDQSESFNQRVVPKSAHKVVKKQQDELNDYLAYQGVKNLKAMELERLKEKEELARCTFKPQVMNYKNTQSYTQSKGNLAQREVDKAIYEQVKSDIELKPCTFKPSLTKKSKTIIAKYSKEPVKSYEILH